MSDERTGMNTDKLDAFLIWIEERVMSSSDLDLFSYEQIAKIASEEYGEDLTAEVISAALTEICRRKNFFVAPWDDGGAGPPVAPARPAKPAEPA